MNPSLTPQKRADKNGKLVTRHVRTGGTDSASGRSIPAPAPAVKERTVKQATKELLDALEQTGDGARFSKNRGWYTKGLDSLPDTKVFDMGFELLENPKVANWVPVFVKETVDRSLEPQEADRLLTVFFSGVELHEKMRGYSNRYAYSNAEQVLSNTYQTMGFGKLKTMDGPITDDQLGYVKSSILLEMAGVKAHNFTLTHEYYGVLSKVKDNWELIEPHAEVLAVADLNKYDPRFGDEVVSLCTMLNEKGIDSRHIADFMKERNVENVERALEMMDSSAQALSSGVL